MTDSQFETLRQELRARFDGVETCLTKLEIHLDAKPDKAFVFQTLFTINASFIALVGLTLLLVRSFLTPA